MLTVEHVISNLKQFDYSITGTSITGVTCAVSPELNSSGCKIIVVCDNSGGLFNAITNIHTIQKILENGYYLPRGNAKREYLFVVVNKWSKKGIKGKNIITINRYQHSYYYDHVDSLFQKELELVCCIVEESGMMYDKFLYNNNLANRQFYKVWLTYVLIGINLIGYLLLRKYNNEIGYSTQTVWSEGEFYRLFTYVLSHGNILHLLGNTVSLYIVGCLFEKRIGAAKTGVIYLISTLYGAIASTLLATNPERITIGASGAICGLLAGLLIVEIKNHKQYADSNIIPILGAIASTLFTGCLMPNIDNWCHIGGLVGGIIFTLIFLICDDVERNHKYIKIQNFFLNKRNKTSFYW